MRVKKEVAALYVGAWLQPVPNDLPSSLQEPKARKKEGKKMKTSFCTMLCNIEGRKYGFMLHVVHFLLTLCLESDSRNSIERLCTPFVNHRRRKCISKIRQPHFRAQICKIQILFSCLFTTEEGVPHFTSLQKFTV